MAWLGAHAAHEQVMTYHEGVWRGVSTALMGRTTFPTGAVGLHYGRPQP